ncbi:MAG: hypothetical protein R3C01_16830 [Planctomycetaceae bacterium]
MVETQSYEQFTCRDERQTRVAVALWSATLGIVALSMAARLGGVVKSDVSLLLTVAVYLFSISMGVGAWGLYWFGRPRRPFSVMLVTGIASSTLPLLAGAALLPFEAALGFWLMAIATLALSLGCTVWTGLTADLPQTSHAFLSASETSRGELSTATQSVTVDRPAVSQPVEVRKNVDLPPFEADLVRKNAEEDVVKGGIVPGEIPVEEVAEVARDIFHDQSISQQVIRRVVGSSVEVEVLARVHFAAGQRQQVFHLPLTPSFASTPEIEVESLGETEVELTVATAYPYGLRLDIRRNESQEAAEALIGLSLSGSVAIAKAA